MITDSRVVQQYYRDTFDAHAEYIAYGADVEPAGRRAQVLARFGLQPARLHPLRRAGWCPKTASTR